jgi:ribosomal protein S18 acetylase RimI-like enzyme
MTFGNNGSISIRKAVKANLDDIKKLADQHKEELGFVLRPALEKSIDGLELFVAENNNQIIGFVHYHHRKDEQTTLYHIVVNSLYRRQGVGKELINALYSEAINMKKEVILLKCPKNLPANSFYEDIGFKLNREEEGKVRALQVWTLALVVS